MRRTAGKASVNDTIHTLIDEKIIFDQATKRNLLPDEKEIESFINIQKEYYNNPDLEYKDFVDTICTNAGITLEAYWNKYEWYNAYRIIAINKVYQAEVAAAQDAGMLPVDESGKITFEEQELYTKYWNEIKLQYKADATIKTNEHFLIK